MIYSYTWNHILLFAQMCDCEDTKVTVTENWVRMLENQQEKMFPFTLWPLTYRTSAVIASTSLVSPAIVTTSQKKQSGADICRVVLKIYLSNEVIIMCFQHVGDDHEGSLCPHLCRFDADAVTGGHGVHSSNKTQPLVPCGLMSSYSKIKKKAMIELSKFRSTQGNDTFSCIVCTGYDVGAVLATFMASDLANEFKSEAEFMGLEESAITVDCVCFSIPQVANDKYWEEFNSLVDKRVSFKHKEEVPVQHPQPTIFVGNKVVPLKMRPNYVIQFSKKKKRKQESEELQSQVANVPCLRYIEDISKTISVFS